ncbi:MAG TPA: sugar-binding protein [Chthoniobacteraceae bacterium]|nr:sugar-binding protein [Chthoniobacteraceae bacterium]
MIATLYPAKGELPPILSRTEKAPEIDGKLARGEWSRAVSLGSFGGEEGEAMPLTRAWITMDATYVYVAVDCDEPKPEAIVTNTLVEERKAAVWDDDSVEIFLDPGNNGEHLFQLVTNTRGTYYDGEVRRGEAHPSGWDSEAVVRTGFRPGGWSAEIAIPFSTLGHVWERGEIVALNVARNRRTVRPPRLQGLAGGSGTYLATDAYPRLLVEGPLEAGDTRLVSTRRGPFLPGVPGQWEFAVIAGKWNPKENEALFSSTTAGRAATPRRLAPKGNILRVEFSEKGARAMARCRLKHKGREIYRSSYEVRKGTKERQRVAVTQQPLFETLREPFPEGLSRHGTISWLHDLMPGLYNFSVRTGAEHTPLLPVREYARDRASLISLTGHWGKPWMKMDLLAKHDVGLVAFLDPRPALNGKGLFGSKGSRSVRPWPLTQDVIAAYLADLEKTLEKARDYPNIRYIFAGDETWEGECSRRLLELLDEKERHPELMAIDREIREKYGFGKYGLPKSATGNDPFSWIATFRWEIDRMLEIQRRVRATIRERAPQMKLVSWDSIGGHRPYAVSRWGEVFDIITFQLYPSMNPLREDFGFVTRFYHDLSGSAETWPLPHVEHYAGNFRPDETEELLSQVFRNGATGLHLYSADTMNGRKGKGGFVTDRVGAPERWQVVQSVIKQLPFKVRQPEADTAIFYSNTSFQGTGPGGGHSLTYSANNEPEWLYTILGPRLGGAFRFIDEVITARDPAALSRFKQIYIPYMPIADDAEVAALEAYVRNGGSLVICDPLAFGFRSDGTRRETGAIIPPLAKRKPRGPMPLTSLLGEDHGELMRIRPTYPLDGRSDRALATYPDGSDAVGENDLGKGKVVFFGTNPLFSNIIGDPAWIAFFAGLQARVEAAKDQPVWRFRLPVTPITEEKVPEHGLCLTGNYFQWRLSVPTPMANATFGGGYRLSVAPDGQTEPAGSEIAFAMGRLTDRLRGAKGGSKEEREAYPPLDAYQLRWNGEEPVVVTYRFAKPVAPTVLRLFYSERLPAGRCEVSADEETWHEVAAWKAKALPDEPTVALERLPLSAKGVAARFVRLRFDPAEGPFTLVETELWGQ